MPRLDDLKRFYDHLAVLRGRVGGHRILADCHARMGWPARGVYFFFEQGEDRSHSGDGRRVVRVGTHAVSHGSRTTLWNRLSQHRGVLKTGGGNHRGSVFRLLVGTAISARSPGLYPETWGRGSSKPRSIREREHELECEVSQHIRAMPLLWLAVEDEPSPNSTRAYIEKNSIALLSNYAPSDGRALDPPSPGWLGRHCTRPKVRESGLWNQRGVDGEYAPEFLELLESLVARMEQSPG